MECPKCRFANADTARFCSNCATSLSSSKSPPAVTKTLESPTRFVARGAVFSGRYEILDSIGAGGMGEVYRALDKNLARQVAIKILPVAFAEDKERMARFDREAKLLAALNHPNIAAIHGLEESEGRRFIVLELAEGETLQSRLHKGALPIEEALETCCQIAEGLEAAHEKGIVHRDLKPGNIMLTPEGKIKILDFGLAKADGPEATSIDTEKSPTITAQMTEPGVILGTAAYMSPEQARGRPVDKRTDIWSFGCVLYECLVGGRAFYGETVSDALAHILKGEPDWGKLPPDTPIRIRTLLRHCLEKSPKGRLHDIADARIEISEAMSEPSALDAIGVRRPSREWVLGGIVCVLAVGALATSITWRLRPRAPKVAIQRFTVKVNPGLWLDGLRRVELQRPTRTAFAFSSDARFLVYSAIAEDPGLQAKPQIYLREMGRMEAAPIAGTEGAVSPFLSPDDRWIGFWADGKLKKVSVSGGVPAPICDAPERPLGADWGPGNMIVFSSFPDFSLSRISSEGGKPEVLAAPDKADGTRHHLPHWLPDGRRVLFTIASSGFDNNPRLAVLDIQSKKWRVIAEDAADGRYVRSGHLIFLRGGTLMAVRFDLDRGEPGGQPVPIVADVMQGLSILNANYNIGAGQFSISDSGCLAYATGGVFPDIEKSLVKVSSKGNVQTVVDFKAPFNFPRLSPDGRRIAYQTGGRENRLWIYDLDRATATPVTREGIVHFATWTPDGQRLVFGWCNSGRANLYWQPADGSSPMERLTTSEDWQTPGSFTPDGAILAFVVQDPETGYDVFFLDMKSRKATPFLNSKAGEGWPEFSPDGHWLAYTSDESGRSEVWVQPFPGPGSKWQISKEGGWQPIWSKDGRQLFYRRTNLAETQGIYRETDEVWVVHVQAGGAFSAGRPRMLFEQSGFGVGWPIRSWDIWPDGQGFLMVKNDERKPDPVTEITVVQNWFEELKRLVPTGKK